MTPPPPGPTTSPDGNVSYSAQPPGAGAPPSGPCQAAQIARDPKSGGFTAQCDNGQPQTFQSFPELAAYLASAFGVSEAPPAPGAAAPGDDVTTESAQ